MINSTDIMIRLNVTEQQIVSAIYSGRIPKPNEKGYWIIDEVELYLDNWDRQLKTHRKTVSGIIERGNMNFPKHQR